MTSPRRAPHNVHLIAQQRCKRWAFHALPTLTSRGPLRTTQQTTIVLNRARVTLVYACFSLHRPPPPTLFTILSKSSSAPIMPTCECCICVWWRVGEPIPFCTISINASARSRKQQMIATHGKCFDSWLGVSVLTHDSRFTQFSKLQCQQQRSSSSAELMQLRGMHAIMCVECECAAPWRSGTPQRLLRFRCRLDRSTRNTHPKQPAAAAAAVCQTECA